MLEVDGMEIRNYVKGARKENGKKRSELCAGVCVESQLRNYENDFRDLNIFVQKRSMERIGCKCGGTQFLRKVSTHAGRMKCQCYVI